MNNDWCENNIFQTKQIIILKPISAYTPIPLSFTLNLKYNNEPDILKMDFRLTSGIVLYIYIISMLYATLFIIWFSYYVIVYCNTI